MATSIDVDQRGEEHLVVAELADVVGGVADQIRTPQSLHLMARCSVVGLRDGEEDAERSVGAAWAWRQGRGRRRGRNLASVAGARRPAVGLEYLPARAGPGPKRNIAHSWAAVQFLLSSLVACGAQKNKGRD